MTALLRPLFERWLLAATQAPLAPWKRTLLRRALQRDEALRCLAMELAVFEHELPARNEGLPDLRPRLQAIVSSGDEVQERPLFPSGWIPAGALALMLLMALLLSVFDAKAKLPNAQEAKAMDNAAAQALAIPSPTVSPTAVVKDAPGPLPTAMP